jgi:hypothetical protein
MPTDKKSLYLSNKVDEDTTEYVINPLVLNEIQRYFELDFYDKKVVSPYFINTKRRKDLRALVGKGTPTEMELETRVWAQVKGLDLKRASSEEIRDLMLNVGIGIDCSGLVIHVLNSFMKKTSNATIFSKLNYKDKSLRARLARLLRPVENINADNLTSEINCHKVGLNNIRPGDFIRGVGKQRNAYHIALVTRVEAIIDAQTGHENIDIVEYVHSHRGYGDENGARRSKVRIIDYNAPLHEQQWLEIHTDGINYLVEMDLKPYPEEVGFRRLKYFADISK